MKNYLLLLLLLVSQNNFAQETIKESQDDLVVDYSVIDVKPDYPGGIKLLFVIFKTNYKAPDKEGLKGKVVVNYIIEKDGSMSNMKVIEDVGYGSGEEAIRVLKKCLNWKPGIHNGKIVRTSHQFKLNIETSG